jgi:anti-sigma regulatory factor (Ser/Thr protein kinase)
MTESTTRPTGGGFDHAALILDSDATLERLLVPVLREHVAAREPVLLVVPPHTEHVLRDRLGADSDCLEWAGVEAFYQRLGFAYDRFRRYLRGQHARGRSVHVIAEPDIATDLKAPVDRVAAYLSYEAMCNDAFAAFGCPVTCIWDSRRHPTLVIEGVRSIHDHELTEEGRRHNREFIPAPDYLAGRAFVAMPPAPPGLDIDRTLTVMSDLSGTRSAVEDWALAYDFSVAAADQVTAAANEVLTNSLQHGQPPVRLRAWRHDQTLVVHVDDSGGRAIPPDAGYRPPTSPENGMGLWITRQFADIVLTRTTTSLTSVRMYFPHAVTHLGHES